jgi:hypothetical protein
LSVSGRTVLQGFCIIEHGDNAPSSIQLPNSAAKGGATCTSFGISHFAMPRQNGHLAKSAIFTEIGQQFHANFSSVFNDLL